MIEFYRERLTREETISYSLMQRGFSKYKYEVDCGSISPDGVAKAYLSLYDDHPELFYISSTPRISQTQAGFAGFGVIRKSSKLTIDPIYSDDQIKTCQRKIEQTVALLKSETSKLKTDEEKIVHVAEYLVLHTDYEINNTYNQNAASALCFGRAQCSGISKAFKLILDSLGMFCIIVNGLAIDNNGQGGSHSWNIVKLANTYYHMDVTFMLGANRQKNTELKKIYLFYDDALIGTNHQWDKCIYPSCNDSSRSIRGEGLTREKYGSYSSNNMSSFKNTNVKSSEEELPHITSLYELKNELRKAIQNTKDIFVCYYYGPQLSNERLCKMVESSCKMVLSQLGLNIQCNITLSGAKVVIQLLY